MPLELQIIRANEFIRLGAHDKMDLESSREVLKQMAGACRRRGIDRALVDLRDIRPGPTPMLSMGDLSSLVNTFREIGFTDQQKVAVLYCADPHHRARLFAFLSTLRGWRVRAFGDYEEAISWLAVMGESDDAPADCNSAISVPVRTEELPPEELKIPDEQPTKAGEQS